MDCVRVMVRGGRRLPMKLHCRHLTPHPCVITSRVQLLQHAVIEHWGWTRRGYCHGYLPSFVLDNAAQEALVLFSMMTPEGIADMRWWCGAAEPAP